MSDDSAAVPGCVVDTSVGLKRFLDEPLSDAAHDLLAGLAADPPARPYVPDLFFAECANILRCKPAGSGLGGSDQCVAAHFLLLAADLGRAG